MLYHELEVLEAAVLVYLQAVGYVDFRGVGGGAVGVGDIEGDGLHWAGGSIRCIRYWA